MSNFKWGENEKTDKPIYVYLLISRHKDNKDVPYFQERRHSFIAHDESARIEREWRHFCDDARSGELCRLYRTLNARDPQKIQRELLKYLIDLDNFDPAVFEQKAVGIAASAPCAAEKNWFFDFDSEDLEELKEFIQDISSYIDKECVTYRRTIHGYAVKVFKHFDTRALLEKWGSIVTLKRDDLLLLAWHKK